MNNFSRFFCVITLGLTVSNKIYCEKYFFKKNDPETCQVNLPEPMAKGFRTKANELLKKNLFQEAIWYLNERKQWNNANHVKKFLRNLMEKENFANFMAPVGTLGGITNPVIYLLPCDVEVVFKEKKNHPSSNYQSEIASYLIDDYFGFNFVPMTVKRKIRGKVGSLQYFVQGTKSVDSIEDYKKSSKLHIFDYIIANKDRNSGNLLFLDGKEVAIDHGLALRESNPIGKNLVIYDRLKLAFNVNADPVRSQIAYPRSSPKLFKKEKKLLDKLMMVDFKSLKELLGKTLRKKNIKLLYSKIAKLIHFTRDTSHKS